MKRKIVMIITLIILIIILIIFSFKLYKYIKIKNAKIDVKLIDNLNDISKVLEERLHGYQVMDRLINGRVNDREIIKKMKKKIYKRNINYGY